MKTKKEREYKQIWITSHAQRIIYLYAKAYKMNVRDVVQMLINQNEAMQEFIEKFNEII